VTGKSHSPLLYYSSFLRVAASGTLAERKAPKKGVRHIFWEENEPDPFAPLTLTLSRKGRGQYWETLRQAQGDRNPMRGLDGGVGAISSRIASNSDWMCASWMATVRSSSANFCVEKLL